jgi:hypothetical protein
VKVLFENEGKGKELYDKLNKFKTNLLNIDPHISYEFADRFSFLPSSITVKDNPSSFTDFFFHNNTPFGALAMLTQFQNTISTMENKVLLYCEESTTSNYVIDDFYSVIVGQNSTYVKAGENIEITAGVGAFSTAGKPEIQINGNIVPLGNEGCAIYKVKALKKPGKHVIPVKISYMDQDGKQQVIDKNVEYTVASDR